MDGHEVHARDAEDVGTGVDLGSVLAVRVGLATRREGGGRAADLRGRRTARRDHGEDTCNLRGAGAELRRGEIAQCQGWCEDKDVLLAPRAGQRSGDLVRLIIRYTGPVSAVGTAREDMEGCT